MGASALYIDSAVPEDTQQLAALLERAGLPARFIEEHVADFVVLREDDKLMGCVGLEIYADSCLLRSLVVAEELRGRGWGAALVKALIARARDRDKELSEIVLLTSTAADLFRRFGFVEVPRDQVNPAIRSSWEFAEEACSSALCMRLKLHP